MPNTIFTPDLFDDTLELPTLGEREDMTPTTTKFYNFNCITLYGYIDSSIATQLSQVAQLRHQIKHLINTPLTLYESPYMAQKFAPTSGNRQLVAFAIWVQDNLYDELDLELEDKIKNTVKKRHTTQEEIKKSIHVIRRLEKFKQDGKSVKSYIVYIIQNQNAIKQIFPLY